MRYAAAALALFLSHCQAPQRSVFCDETVTVIETNLDGCGLLLQLRNGKTLLPVNGDAYHYAAGDQLAISYVDEDAMSICMAESQTIRLTCAFTLTKGVCEPIEHVSASDWVAALVDDWQPVMVTRYDYLDGHLYEARKQGQHRWYDCRGNRICDEQTDCSVSADLLQNKTEIWVAHR